MINETHSLRNFKIKGNSLYGIIDKQWFENINFDTYKI